MLVLGWASLRSSFFSSIDGGVPQVLLSRRRVCAYAPAFSLAVPLGLRAEVCETYQPFCGLRADFCQSLPPSSSKRFLRKALRVASCSGVRFLGAALPVKESITRLSAFLERVSLR